MTPAPTWVDGVDGEHPFGIHNLAYGAGRSPGWGDRPRVMVRIGELGLDLATASRTLAPALAPYLQDETLNPLLAAGPATWSALRTVVREWLTDQAHRPEVEPLLHPLDPISMCLPVAVGDYVDFYASEHHATNVGRLFRPGSPPLPDNWKHLPIGYHGRSGTVVVSGTPVIRPRGQRRAAGGAVEFGPSARLDIEAEIGFVLGGATDPGRPIPLASAAEHIFGACVVNDWSARDLQAWEYTPLGPFLGKSFATSVSPWIVPLAALDHARIRPPVRDVPLLPYLDDSGEDAWALDLELRVELNGEVVSRPPFASMYWTAAQMLAHMTVNGATVRPGDLFASGTVSGPAAGQAGSLLELTSGGAAPIRLRDGDPRGFLRDGDEVSISAGVPARDGRPALSLGSVVGRVVAAAGTLSSAG